MIEIIQQKVPNVTMANPYNKMDEITIVLNKELIKNDLDRLKEFEKEPKNKYDKANIKMLIAYLEKILKNIDEESAFEICWESRENIPHTYPVDLINEKAYGIDICNYIELSEDEKLVEMNMTDLADIIAFEIMSRDLGETHDTVEKLLSNCGIIGFEPASLLTDYFKSNGDQIFKLSKSMRIGETPYYSYETKKMHDYFSSKEFKTKEYKEVVDYSCRYANTIVMNTIIKNSLHSGTEIKVIMVNATNIAFVVSTTDEVNIKQNIIDEVSVRAFGRQFKIEPDIQIF